MTLVSTLYAPQESVNDQFLSLISVLVKTGDFVKADTLIAELETSKAVVEVMAENDGYIKVFVAANTDVFTLKLNNKARNNKNTLKRLLIVQILL